MKVTQLKREQYPKSAWGKRYIKTGFT